MTSVYPPGVETTPLQSPVMALLKHMLRGKCQSGSLKDRCTFGGAGQRLRSAAQTWVPESKARTKLMPTIDLGSLSMSYERLALSASGWHLCIG